MKSILSLWVFTEPAHGPWVEYIAVWDEYNFLGQLKIEKYVLPYILDKGISGYILYDKKILN